MHVIDSASIFQILHHSPQIPFHHLIHQHIRLFSFKNSGSNTCQWLKIGIRKVFRQSGQQGGSEGVAVNRDAARVGVWTAEMWAMLPSSEALSLVDGYVVSIPGYICFGIVAHGFWHVEQVRQIARIAWLIGDSDVLDRRGGAASGIDDLPETRNPAASFQWVSVLKYH